MKWRIRIHDVILKALGVLLIVAAVLKGHELLTVPVANKDLWSWRPFLIFQVEFELALGIWLLSGVFKRLAWLAALACFTLFCCVTLYKGLTGAASCGCFGTVHVNPWVTLAVIDLPATILLLILRPQGVFASLGCSWGLTVRLLRLSWRIGRRVIQRTHSHAGAILGRVVARTASVRLLATMATIAVVLGATTPILALNGPAKATAKYEVLEPETWVGKELPILKYIDIADQLKRGTWLVLFYHHDCPDCQRTIPRYKQMARNLGGNEDFLRIALIAVPPYSWGLASENCACALGRLADVKEWFVITPTTILTYGAEVRAVWQGDTSDFNTIFAPIIGSELKNARGISLHINNNSYPPPE